MYSLGIDIGTSGIRAAVIDQSQSILAQAQTALPDSKILNLSQQKTVGYSQDPQHWWTALETVIFALKNELASQTNIKLNNITHLAIDGTSGTVLLTDERGLPCSDALMYNDQRSLVQAQKIDRIAPTDTAATGTASGLAKLLWLYENCKRQDNVYYALNQSDWLSSKLTDSYGFSDHNNALKMGYDAKNHCWPDWLQEFLKSEHFPDKILPKVFKPGQPIAPISASMADHFGFSDNLIICAGTTDSTAAIIASGVKDIGEAVTSLGSTLVMKVITNTPLFNAQYGIYSQPYGDRWLVGGGSNSGGAVLKSLFCPGEISKYTEKLNQSIDNQTLELLNLSYYPLLSPGERFPIHKPDLTPKMTSRPDNDVDFFQALLEGMADIETQAYQRLLELGTPYPKRVTSIGGGAFNRAWRYIRELKLNVPVKLAQEEQPAVGTALLAQSSWSLH